MFLLALMSVTPALRAGEVVVVLSMNAGPYAEAYKGFAEAYGEPVRTVDLSKEAFFLPSGTEYVVAIGGKAALEEYPRRVGLVYCLAPGVRLDPAERRGPTVLVSMLPSPDALLDALRDIAPGRRRWGVLWMSDAYDDGLAEIARRSSQRGEFWFLEKLRSPEELPERLRVLGGKVDALWVPPDPLFINPQSVSTIRDFSWSNGLPFFTSVAGLDEDGAAAAAACPFRAVGATAARALRRLAEGAVPTVEFPETVEITLNLTAARRAGLAVPPETVRKAARVIP